MRCIVRDFGTYLVRLVASSDGADWWYVIGTTRSRIKAYGLSRFAHGRPPWHRPSRPGRRPPWHFVRPAFFASLEKPLHLRTLQIARFGLCTPFLWNHQPKRRRSCNAIASTPLPRIHVARTDRHQRCQTRNATPCSQSAWMCFDLAFQELTAVSAAIPQRCWQTHPSLLLLHTERCSTSTGLNARCRMHAGQPRERRRQKSVVDRLVDDSLEPVTRPVNEVLESLVEVPRFSNPCRDACT